MGRIGVGGGSGSERTSLSEQERTSLSEQERTSLSDEGYHHWNRLGKTNSDTKIQGLELFRQNHLLARNFLVFDH